MDTRWRVGETAGGGGRGDVVSKSELQRERKRRIATNARMTRNEMRTRLGTELGKFSRFSLAQQHRLQLHNPRTSGVV